MNIFTSQLTSLQANRLNHTILKLTFGNPQILVKKFVDVGWLQWVFGWLVGGNKTPGFANYFSISLYILVSIVRV